MSAVAPAAEPWRALRATVPILAMGVVAWAALFRPEIADLAANTQHVDVEDVTD